MTQTGDVERVLAEVFRQDWGRVVAALIARTGDIELAEDSAQEAFTAALPAWRRDGVPRAPLAWLITTARNRALDRLRRDQVGAAKLRQLATESTVDDYAVVDDAIPDERLRLLFTCCHPALAFESQVALALRTLCGLSTAEIARAFLVPEATMAKRLVRTKQKIAVAGIPYRVPPAHRLPERTTAVLGVLYLLFHEGYVATAGPDLGRWELAARAIDLAGLLVTLMPDHPEARGLLALLLLIDARASARVDGHGHLVPLEEQDRTRWDADTITRGLSQLEQALRRGQPGPYQLQALIAACHATAPTPEATDWARIVSLYDQLLELVPSTTVRLNRAIAIAMRDGPRAGLEELAGLPDHPLLEAARADLLRRLGQRTEAADAYRQALERTDNDGERGYLRRRLAEVTTTLGT